MRWTWAPARGLNQSANPARLEPGEYTNGLNVLLAENTLGRRRPGLGPLSTTTSAPTGAIVSLVPRTSDSVLAFSNNGATPEVHRYNFSAWSAVTISDTAALFGPTALNKPAGVTFNGKTFLAYNSDVNRLHVMNSTGVVMRRVGIEASAAATVADGGGAGAYATTTRFYKIQFKLISGSDTLATSELSAAVSFAPSGANANATVTKPTTPDSATHWVVFASVDNVTYYNLSGNIVVGTTTYADSTVTTAYSSGTVAPSAGLYVPPPSARYLLTDGNRLFMAGCYESTATAKQTATRTSRVWFTQALGALDNTGEDEAIAQTTAFKDWIDVGEQDGDEIRGLAGPVDGVVYVFKNNAIYQLLPTGLSESPYRTERVADNVGLALHNALTAGFDGAGAPCVYFMTSRGPARISPRFGVETLKHDLPTPTAGTNNWLGSDAVFAAWSVQHQMVGWYFQGQTEWWSFQPEFEARVGAGRVTGGWMRHQWATTYGTTAAALVVLLTGAPPQLWLAGTVGSAGRVASYFASYREELDIETTALSAYVESTFATEDGARYFRLLEPRLEWRGTDNNDAGFTVRYTRVLPSAAEDYIEATGGGTASASSSRYQWESIQGLSLGDCRIAHVKITFPTADASTRELSLLGVSIPYEIEGQT
jgi:hypothetical protein